MKTFVYFLFVSFVFFTTTPAKVFADVPPVTEECDILNDDECGTPKEELEQTS